VLPCPHGCSLILRVVHYRIAWTGLHGLPPPCSAQRGELIAQAARAERGPTYAHSGHDFEPLARGLKQCRVDLPSPPALSLHLRAFAPHLGRASATQGPREGLTLSVRSTRSASKPPETRALHSPTPITNVKPRCTVAAAARSDPGGDTPSLQRSHVAPRPGTPTAGMHWDENETHRSSSAGMGESALGNTSTCSPDRSRGIMQHQLAGLVPVGHEVLPQH